MAKIESSFIQDTITRRRCYSCLTLPLFRFCVMYHCLRKRFAISVVGSDLAMGFMGWDGMICAFSELCRFGAECWRAYLIT